MVKEIKGALTGKGRKLALVVSRTNEFITNRLLDGAIDTLVRQEVAEDDITVVHVPGSFEIPPAARRLAESKTYDAVICLGTIIRGSTAHFEYIAAEVAKGVAQAAVATGLPVIFGVLTTDSIEQAIERSGSKSGNKGRDAAFAALEMANLFSQM